LINFPNSPTVGQVYTPFGGVSWLFDGDKWSLPQHGDFLPLLGGTMLGPIILDADPTDPFGAATKRYVDAQPHGIDDAVPDNFNYVRRNNAWLRDPIQTDALSNGQLYGRVNASWALAYPAGNPAGYQTQVDVVNLINTYLPATGIADAPSDGTSYVRSNGAWVTLVDAGTY
jgi:hypothetical protein